MWQFRFDRTEPWEPARLEDIDPFLILQYGREYVQSVGVIEAMKTARLNGFLRYTGNLSWLASFRMD